MNKHLKLAFIIAPFLGIGAYVATGYFAQSKIDKAYNEERFIQLLPQGNCHILQGECKLESGKFLMSLEHQQGITHLKTTHPIENAVVSYVDIDGKEKLHKMEQMENLYNWKAQTNLSSVLSGNPVQNLRVLLTVKKVTYLGEVKTTPP